MEKEAIVIAKLLVGTTRTVDEVLHEEGINPVWFEFYDGYDMLNDMIYQCDGCGTWCALSDIHFLGGDAFCQDCLYLEIHTD